jgi:hypothetical protein
METVGSVQEEGTSILHCQPRQMAYSALQLVSDTDNALETTVNGDVIHIQ